ncbi:MAG: HlyD family secretion protein [Alphaproteobacteria bacterium]
MPDEGRIPEPGSIAADETLSADARAGKRVFARILRFGIIGLIVLAALLSVGRWGYWQWSHVSETDARVKAATIAVSSRVSGWIVDIPVSDGARISKGDVLVEIDSRESKLRLAEHGSQISALAAEREQITAQIELIELTTARRVDALRSRAESAQVAVQAGREQYDLARAEFERSRALLKDGVVSRQRLDQVQAELSRAQERHEKARSNLAAALADVAEAEAERGQIKVLASRIEELRYEEAQIAAQRDRQGLDVADRTIKSAVTGIVSETFVDMGEYVNPGQRLMLVHNPDAIWVEANIKETDIRHLSPGMAVDVSFDAYPNETFQGTVERIGQAATSEFALLPNPNPSGNFTKVTQRLPVRIAIDQADGKLRPGMMAIVDIAIPGR